MSRGRRRRRSGPPKCDRCSQVILWLKLRGKWRPFEPRPLRTGDLHANGRYPVEGKTAWPLEDLVEELMGRRRVSEAVARDEAYDFPFYTPHSCPDSEEQTQ